MIYDEWSPVSTLLGSHLQYRYRFLRTQANKVVAVELAPPAHSGHWFHAIASVTVTNLQLNGWHFIAPLLLADEAALTQFTTSFKALYDVAMVLLKKEGAV